MVVQVGVYISVMNDINEIRDHMQHADERGASIVKLFKLLSSIVMNLTTQFNEIRPSYVL